MKQLLLVLYFTSLILVIASQYESLEDLKEEAVTYDRVRRQDSRIARVGCRNGQFTCRATGLRAISCATNTACRNCQIRRSEVRGALDLYCNDGSNPNGYARCSVDKGRVLCIA